MAREWYHPLEIIKNRYLVRFISCIFHLVPFLVLNTNTVVVIFGFMEAEWKQLKAITTAIQAFNIIGIIIHILFMFFYCFKSRNENYKIVIGTKEFDGLTTEVCVCCFSCD